MKRILFYLLPILILFVGCRDDFEDGISTPSPTHREVKVPFSISMPAQTAKTYALEENDENEVRTIDILAFKVNGTQETFAYRAQADQGSIVNDGGSNKKKFIVTLLKDGSQPYCFVVLANATEQLDATFPAGIAVDANKEAIMQQLKVTGTNKWNVDTHSEDYIPMPMWGETAKNTIIQDNTSITGLSLMRMVAKIDVKVDPLITEEKFSLSSVSVYNYYSAGQIAPDQSNLASNSTSSVTMPTVAGSATKGPLSYDEPDLVIDNKMLNSIYVFESAVPRKNTEVEMDKVTTLVIGGTYKGATTESYYRVDIVDKNKNYLDILRNHQYTINIIKVKSAGYTSKEEAFNSRAVNIEAEVIVWDDAKIGDIVFDGQYMMGVSKREYSFSRDQRTEFSDDNMLSVTTDYPGGWKVEKTVDLQDNPPEWLTLTPDSGGAGATTDTRILVEENTTGLSRTALIHLIAGRLTYTVKVVQDVNASLNIFITDMEGHEISMLDFGTKMGENPDMQQFKLRWFPALSPLSFTTNSINNPFVFSSEPGLDVIPTNGTVSDPEGMKTYSIKPATPTDLKADAFYESTSIMLYAISDGISTANKTLVLRHIIYNMIPYKDDYYPMDGLQKYFTVKSNAAFTVAVKYNPNNVISLRTAGGGANTTGGTRVYFDIENDLINPTLFQKQAVVTIKSPDDLFPETDVTLNCVSGTVMSKANSYIVKPNSNVGILIPVQRANDAIPGQLGANTEYTANLEWTDNSNRIADNSNIKLIAPAGKGENGYILVLPGSEPGNAVVSAKVGNTVIWSWHIWVTDFEPLPMGTNQFMDRNLGALSNEKNNVGTLGLTYQWGRKDPFPGTASVSESIEPTIYNANGKTKIDKEPVSVKNNLKKAIANPKTFYCKKSIPFDWYSNGINTDSEKDDKLWDNGGKTIYDPCPDGWRVPAFIGGSTSPWSGLDYNNFVLGDRGRTNNAYGGYYPFSGYRDYNTGEFTNVGEIGVYFAATPAEYYGYSYSLFIHTGKQVTPGSSTYRARGNSVRCVKE